MNDHDTEIGRTEPPISLSHLVQTIRAYSAVIALAVSAVAVGYAIIAITIYLLAPSYRTTSQAFRLDFEGATRGTYPNGMKFSTAEIASAPILLKVFNDNDLGRFTTAQKFAQSIIILESNPEYEVLAAEYQARLADPKLTPVDRERMQKDWQQRTESLSKNDRAITYLQSRDDGVIPDTIVRKVLIDILTAWSNFAVREQHVLDYDVSVLSPDVAAPTLGPDMDPFVAVQTLRSNTMRVLASIDTLRQLPAVNLVRTTKSHVSLADVRLQLEDIARYRLEPLVGRIHDASLSRNPEETVRLVESQLAYDERQLNAQRNRAETIHQVLLAYAGPQSQGAQSPTLGNSSSSSLSREGETVMPQLSDSFIDRLVTLATQSTDVQYRQDLVNNYRDVSMAIVPLEQAVDYDKSVLGLLRSAPRGGAKADPRAITAEIEKARNDIRFLAEEVSEIHQILSENLNPSTHLVAATLPPVTRVERAVSVERLTLYGILACILTFPLSVILSLLHNRVREEEQLDAYEEARSAEQEPKSADALA